LGLLGLGLTSFPSRPRITKNQAHLKEKYRISSRPSPDEELCDLSRQEATLKNLAIITLFLASLSWTADNTKKTEALIKTAKHVSKSLCYRDKQHAGYPVQETFGQNIPCL
jgi:hypothetical protein